MYAIGKSSKKLMIAIGGVTAQVVIDIMFCVKTWSKNRYVGKLLINN